MLREIDEEELENSQGNLRRIIRALEIYEITGEKKSTFAHEKKLRFSTLFLTPYDGNREKLYERIEQRIDMMMEQGLLAEVQGLLGKYKETDFGMNAIGYREFFPYFSGDISLSQAVSHLKQNTRNYAKRQCTWFRAYEKF